MSSIGSTRSRGSALLRAFALLAALAMVVAACGGDDDSATGGGDGNDASGDADGLLAQLQDQGYIEVGIANEVPYGFENEDGEVTGEAPEVARVVFEELGVPELRATVVDFGSLISGLQAGQFDMIAAGMYINADRAEQILFSDPDYCVGEAFAVPEGNPAGLTDFASVAEDSDITIALLEGAVEVGYADAAGVPDGQIELFADVNAQYDALEAGRVDAVAGTYLTVKQQTDVLDGFEPTESFTPVDADGNEVLGCGGFGFRNEDQALRDAFNDQLNQLQEEGALVDVITQFGFAEEDVLQAQDLTVEDLTGG